MHSEKFTFKSFLATNLDIYQSTPDCDLQSGTLELGDMAL